MTIDQKLALKRSEHVKIYKSLEDNPNVYIEDLARTKLFLEMEKELIYHVRERGLLSRYSYQAKNQRHMKKHSQENNYHFFDDSSMVFFRISIEYIDKYGLFVTKEINPQGEKAYTVRLLTMEGSTQTLGGFHVIDAIVIARKMTKKLGGLLDICTNNGENL